MAIRRICSIDGCGKAHRARGYCSAHYLALWRTTGKIDRTPHSDFLTDLIGHDKDQCVPWPYRRSPGGYGTLHYNGRQRIASNLMCELQYGPAPSPNLQAAHSCGNGHLGCVNPKHLRWATAKENAADKPASSWLTSRRDEGGGPQKLNSEKVAAIRADTRPGRTIAKELGVSYETVRSVRRGETWANVPLPSPIATIDALGPNESAVVIRVVREAADGGGRRLYRSRVAIVCADPALRVELEAQAVRVLKSLALPG
jgi:hypothetical protein